MKPLTQDSELHKILKGVLASHPVGVLATCDSVTVRPYASLIAFGYTRDLRRILFATPIATRKYVNLLRCPNVALLMDNRGVAFRDIGGAAAATAQGECRNMQPDLDDPLVSAYMHRHPQLRDFLLAPTSAVFEIQVQTYQLVQRFQEVTEIPMV